MLSYQFERFDTDNSLISYLLWSNNVQAPVQTFQPQDYNLMTPTQPAAMPTPIQPNMMLPNQPPMGNQYIVQQQNGPPGAPGPQPV